MTVALSAAAAASARGTAASPLFRGSRRDSSNVERGRHLVLGRVGKKHEGRGREIRVRRRASPSATASPSSPSTSSYLVTGAAGFIGSHLVEALLSKGASVVAVDSLDEGGPYPREWKESNVELLRRVAKENEHTGARLMFRELDAGDREAMRAVFFAEEKKKEETNPMPPVTRVCHLGARSGVKGSIDDPEGAVAANVLSTAVLLDLAAAAKCRSFVLASSGSVYGECTVDDKGEPVASREGDSTDSPISPYAASKRAAELMAHAFWHMSSSSSSSSNGNGESSPRVTVTRIFTVYGPRGRPDMAVFRFITAMLSGADVFRFGDGMSTWRDYAHVDDVVAGLVAAMHRGDEMNEGEDEEEDCNIQGEGESGKGEGEQISKAGGGGVRGGGVDDDDDGFVIVNLASGRPTRLGELIAATQDACDHACRSSDSDGGIKSSSSCSTVIEKPGRPGDVGGTYADISKARDVLQGWGGAKITLKEGLRRTAEWYATEEEAQKYSAASEK